MDKIKQYLTPFLIVLSSLCFAQITTDNKSSEKTTCKVEFRYPNPITRDTSISMRDHFIIKVGSKWYSTGSSNPVWTGLNHGVRLLVSDDLLHWKQPLVN
jgi:xylan 1,4-beta-xylosidase